MPLSRRYCRSSNFCGQHEAWHKDDLHKYPEGMVHEKMCRQAEAGVAGNAPAEPRLQFTFRSTFVPILKSPFAENENAPVGTYQPAIQMPLRFPDRTLAYPFLHRSRRGISL